MMRYIVLLDASRKTDATGEPPWEFETWSCKSDSAPTIVAKGSLGDHLKLAVALWMISVLGGISRYLEKAGR